MIFSSFMLIIGSLLFGALITLIVQCYFIRKYFYHQECVVSDAKTKSEPFEMPKYVLDFVKMENLPLKENCVAINLLLQFLFHELRDTEKVRLWFWNKLSLEFEELLTRTTVGRMFSGIQIKDINLGSQFPIIKNINVQNVDINKIHHHIDTLDLKLDIQYNGGFQLMINANMLLGKAAYLSIKVVELIGEGRLQFTRIPYSHWSFTFYHEPKLKLEVESQFQGRPLPQITALITSQIRKSLKKKHTVPHYKLRYKPFFNKVEDTISAESVSMTNIQITLHRISRLNELLIMNNVQKDVYCVVGVGNVAWVDVVQYGSNYYMILDLVIIKKFSLPLGLVFKQEFVEDKNKMCVMLATVGANSPAQEAEVCKDDIIVSVDGKKVTTLQQAPKFIKSSAIQFTLRVERRVRSCTVSELEQCDNAKSVKKQSVDGCDSSHGSTPSTSTPGSPAKKLTKITSSPEHVSTIKQESVVLDEAKGINLLKTKSVSCSQVMTMNETVKLSVAPGDKYVNINIKSDKDVSVGYINIPLSSLMSLVDTMKRYDLRPPDSFAAALSRGSKLSTQNGFSSQLCYGDILLTVQHTVKQEVLPGAMITVDSLEPTLSTATVTDHCATPMTSRPGSGTVDKKHDFVRTHFQSSTQCEFCGKKIWLKDAMQCKECSMACHKKCIAKCQTSATCGVSQTGTNLSVLVGTTATALNIVDTDGDDNSEGDTVRRRSIQPEIVTTHADEMDKTTPVQVNPARKGLSGLIASVASASRGLKRVGSANNLTLPNTAGQVSQQCRSLPPSPQQTPSASRKASLPMDLSEDINEALQVLLQQGTTDQGEIMDFAKASGKTLYENLDLPQRKEKINGMIEKLNIAFNAESEIRSSLVREEINCKDETSKTKLVFLMGKSDEKTQALTVLMLHCFAGLQHIQDLEEQERDNLNECLDTKND